jgi:phosphoribosylamine-glycine ligase
MVNVDSTNIHLGIPSIGMLCISLTVTETGPKLLEYNVRFGDPEAQILLPLLTPDMELANLMIAYIENRLMDAKFDFMDKSAVNVVAAAGGYPLLYENGAEISIGALPKGK